MIRINQTLHGYADGHRLLAASTPFMRETKRIMLVLSDMSGSSMRKGFESYLTGYPLEYIETYVIAKTWYAPEMKRPGCVWTHSMLIDFSDMAQITDFGFLSESFTRPDEKFDFSIYKKPIQISNSPSGISGNNNFDFSKDMIESILTALYGLENKQIFIVSDSTEKFENLFFAILSQQWPELRQTFYFCTGSLSNLEIDNKTFHFQVIPENLSTSLRSKIKAEFIDISEQQEKTTNIPLWVTSAYEDLFLRGKTDLRKFLSKFGADMPNNRRTFSYLTGIFALVNAIRQKKASVPDLLEKLNRFFPKPNEAVKLKELILAGQEFKIAPESEFLIELITTPHYTSLDPDNLDITVRAEQFWISNSDKAHLVISQLFEAEPNPFTEKFFIGIAFVINERELFNLAQEDPKLLFAHCCCSKGEHRLDLCDPDICSSL